MFGARWQLFRLLGIPVSLDLSWLIILALLTLSYVEIFPQNLQDLYPGETVHLSMADYWIMGLVTALAFFTCIVLHEFGHAIVARARGMPINGITLFMFGGVSELGEEPRSAKTEFLMAIAGPVVSAILALIFWIIFSVGYQSGWPHPIVFVIYWLAWINLFVLIFNLIPAFPLDGGRVLRSILWGITGSVRKATRWASGLGRIFAGILIAIGVLMFFFQLWLGGIWLALIGMFLYSAARSGYQQVLIRQALQGESVGRVMNSEPIVVAPSLDLLHWVDDYVYRYHHRSFPVASDGHLEGLITTQALNQVPRREWAEHTVGEVMLTDVRALSITPNTDAMQALGKMQRTESNMLLVTDAGRLVGVVTLKNLLHFLSLRLELSGDENDIESLVPTSEPQDKDSIMRN